MEREWYQHCLELCVRVKLLMMVTLHFECSRNKRGLVPIDYATTDDMRAILSASTLKTCSQGSTQLRILSLPENGKVSLSNQSQRTRPKKSWILTAVDQLINQSTNKKVFQAGRKQLRHQLLQASCFVLFCFFLALV